MHLSSSLAPPPRKVHPVTHSPSTAFGTQFWPSKHRVCANPSPLTSSTPVTQRRLGVQRDWRELFWLFGVPSTSRHFLTTQYFHVESLAVVSDVSLDVSHCKTRFSAPDSTAKKGASIPLLLCGGVRRQESRSGRVLPSPFPDGGSPCGELLQYLLANSSFSF